MLWRGHPSCLGYVWACCWHITMTCLVVYWSAPLENLCTYFEIFWMSALLEESRCGTFMDWLGQNTLDDGEILLEDETSGVPIHCLPFYYSLLTCLLGVCDRIVFLYVFLGKILDLQHGYYCFIF